MFFFTVGAAGVAGATHVTATDSGLGAFINRSRMAPSRHGSTHASATSNQSFRKLQQQRTAAQQKTKGHNLRRTTGGITKPVLILYQYDATSKVPLAGTLNIGGNTHNQSH